jgi:hypothetical protein
LVHGQTGAIAPSRVEVIVIAGNKPGIYLMGTSKNSGLPEFVRV